MGTGNPSESHPNSINMKNPFSLPTTRSEGNSTFLPVWGDIEPQTARSVFLESAHTQEFEPDTSVLPLLAKQRALGGYACENIDELMCETSSYDPAVKQSASAGGDYIKCDWVNQEQGVVSKTSKWNVRYQDIMARYDKESSPEEKAQIYSEIANVGKDFADAASTYGSLIIKEHLLPNEQKTIKPIQGGRVGGQKYIVHDIFFKFAIDHQMIVGGDENAMKIAAHELSALNIMMDNRVPDLFFPLMALVDYRGYRLVAISTLPINSETICHGSSDAGSTIHAGEIPDLDRKISEICSRLNLRSHQFQGKTFYGPVDLEGHLGEDGRYYLLDFSRLMPPDGMNQALKHGYLYRLFRPELVLQYEVPLCSDSLSRFVETNQKEYTIDVFRANNYLVNTIVPNFAKMLASQSPDGVSRCQLIQTIHRQGINVRYIGLIYQALSSAPKTSFGQHWRIRLLTEGIARVLRVLFRENLREQAVTQAPSGLPLSVPFLESVTQFLNSFFGRNLVFHWKKADIGQQMVDRFKFDKNNSADLAALFQTEDCFRYLFNAFSELTNLRFTPEGVQLITSLDCLKSEKPFKYFHIRRFEPRVKYPAFIEYASGMACKHQAKQSSDPSTMKAHINLAKQCFERALHVSPNHSDTLVQMGAILALEGNFSQADLLLRLAFISSVESKKPVILCKCARLYHKHKRNNAAIQQIYQQAIEYDKNYLKARLYLAEFQTDQHQLHEAYQTLKEAYPLVNHDPQKASQFSRSLKKFLSQQASYTEASCMQDFVNYAQQQRQSQGLRSSGIYVFQ